MGLSRKGAIEPGADADLVLFDPLREQTICAATHHSAVDYTPYEGMRLTGAVERVWLRGRLAVDGGAVVARQGSGGYVRCEPGVLT
jgi:dihydropyrimidinase